MSEIGNYRKEKKETPIVVETRTMYWGKKRALNDSIRYFISNYKNGTTYAEVSIKTREGSLKGIISVDGIKSFLGYDFRLHEKIWNEFKPSKTKKLFWIPIYKTREGKLYHKRNILNCFKESFNDYN